MLVQSFVYTNFNYCPLVWYFSSAKSLQKIEQLQERALRFLYNDHITPTHTHTVKKPNGYGLITCSLYQIYINAKIKKERKNLKKTSRRSQNEFLPVSSTW